MLGDDQLTLDVSEEAVLTCRYRVAYMQRT